MVKLATIRPRIATTDTRRVPPPPKTADPYYLTPEHKAWRLAVMNRAGWRCEGTDNGARCTKHAPTDRLFANHIKERRDGGDPLDPMNGNALCGSHHPAWTAAQRAKRRDG